MVCGRDEMLVLTFSLGENYLFGRMAFCEQYIVKRPSECNFEAQRNKENKREDYRGKDDCWLFM
jgi:hypothetical protein